MKTLLDQKKNSCCEIKSIQGSARFIGRITSMGLIPGTPVKILQNKKNLPLIIYARDTQIAVNRHECQFLVVTEGKK